MANGLYTKAKEGMLDGSIIWTTDNIRAVLIKTASYTVNLSTDANLSDIPTAARIAVSPILSSRTATGGRADSADPSFSSVTGSGSVNGVVFYKDTGSEASSRLLAYFDTGITGLPFTPDGGDVALTVNGSGLFSL